MTIAPNDTATTHRITLEEFFGYDDGTESRYELVEGVLVEMGAESALNVDIAMFLISELLKFVPYYLVHRGTEIVTPESSSTSRYPDLLVLGEACAAALAGKSRSVVTTDMPVPVLVVEVVSPGEPGTSNYDRDYVEKPREYAARGIPEYWLIDPGRQVVLVLRLQDGKYREQRFQGEKTLVSPTFPELNLTAEQLLRAGK